jgi:hypothetical protein
MTLEVGLGVICRLSDDAVRAEDRAMATSGGQTGRMLGEAALIASAALLIGETTQAGALEANAAVKTVLTKPLPNPWRLAMMRIGRLAAVNADVPAAFLRVWIETAEAETAKSPQLVR